MQIGILGAGNVGGTLGRGWAARGHRVIFGVRNPASPESQTLQASGMQVGTQAEAVASGEVIALTVPWEAVQSLLATLRDSLTGKILFDCTNPNFTADPAHTHPVSGGQRVVEWAPGARVVKIFNTTGWENMADPQYGAERATMFFAGDEPAAKAVAADLAAALGFEPVDTGPMANAELLESLARLWGKLAYGQKLGRSIAFRLMHR